MQAARSVPRGIDTTPTDRSIRARRLRAPNLPAAIARADRATDKTPTTPKNDDTRDPMIIHSATVELHPTDLSLLRESGLPIEPTNEARNRVVPVGRADLASALQTARANTDDPTHRAVFLSFLKQLRA
jgi:hypothetical protein